MSEGAIMLILIAGLLVGAVLVPIAGLVATFFGASAGTVALVCMLALGVSIALGFPIHDAFVGNREETTRLDHEERLHTSYEVVAKETGDEGDDWIYRPPEYTRTPPH